MVFTETTFQNCIEKINEINAILFFQPNFGLATTFAEKIQQNYTYDEIVVIDFQDVEKTFISILKEYICDSFFATKKIIKIYNFNPNGRSKLKDELKFLNDKNIKDKLVLFFAPELDGKSAFKTLFEKGDFTASIACYNDDEKTAIQVIRNFFTEKNVKITEDAIKMMAEMLHGDRKMLMSECEKIFLYCNNKEITLHDIEKAIINEQSANPIAFSDYLLAGNIKKAIKEFDLINKEDNQIILLTRLFIKSVEEILSIKNITQNGANIDEVIKSKFIFWKRVPLIKTAIQASTIKMLENYIKIAVNTEKIAKTYGNDIAKQYFIRNVILFKVR